MKPLSIHLTLAAGILAGTGCVSTEKTTYRDEARVKVEFENDTAARLFYETLSTSPSGTGKTESNTEVSLPVVFKHKERVVQGESIAFNTAVRRCDTNADSKITELEARIFAGQAAKP
jgi:hypothetical protein